MTSSKANRLIILLSECKSGSTIFQDEMARQSYIRLLQETGHVYHETRYWVKAACMLGLTVPEMEQEPAFNGWLPADYWRALPREARRWLRPRAKRLVGLSRAPQLRIGRPDWHWDPAAARAAVEPILAHNAPEFAQPQDDAQLIADGWDALVMAQPGVLFEKSPAHLQHASAVELILKMIARADYDVHVIGLVRNPMAVMHSAWRGWQSDPEPRQHIWRVAYENLLHVERRLAADRYLRVNYEQFVTEPKAVLQTVCDFAGLQFEAGMGDGVRTSHREKWRSDADFRFELAPEIGRLAQQLGYEPDDLTRQPIATAAQ